MAEPTLEGLPLELKLSILKQIPDYASLKAFVQASSEYYQVYSAFQTEILFNLLYWQYDGQVDPVESLATVRSKGLWASETKNTEQIIALLDFRRRASREGSGKKYETHSSFSPEELLGLLDLHEAAIFFLKDYSENLRQPLWWGDAQGDWETTVLPIRFSPNERARFFRAFYRFQTWCNIFGHKEYHPSWQSETQDEFENAWMDKTFSQEDAWRLLWGTIPPWELEEIACIWMYCKSKYQQSMDKFTQDLVERYDSESSNDHPSISSHEHGDLLPPDTRAWLLDELSEDEYKAELYRKSMIEIGPYFVFKILQLPYKERIKEVALNMRTIYRVKFWDIAQASSIRKYPLLSPADRYERRDLDDVISSFPILEQASQAWMRSVVSPGPLHPGIWLTDPIRYDHHAIFCFVEEWKWGYVLWDAERIEQWKMPLY